MGVVGDRALTWNAAICCLILFVFTDRLIFYTLTGLDVFTINEIFKNCIFFISLTIIEALTKDDYVTSSAKLI